MATKGEKTLIGVVITAGVLYIAYKILTRPSNAGLITRTNTKGILPTVNPSNPLSNNPQGSVPLNNIGKEAYTNKSGVKLLRSPGLEYFLGIPLFNNVDQTIAGAGVNVGQILEVDNDVSGSLSDQWYKLSKTSGSFFHGGDDLYVKTTDVYVQ